MMLRAAVACILFAAWLPAADWVKITSPNFELFTTAGERTGKNTVRHFEQVRQFFIEQTRGRVSSPNKVRLVGFSSDKEWAIYRPNEGAAAFYLPTPDRDYIVMSRLDENLFKVAVHEYVHLLVKHSGAKMPVWLNEGTADFYSTITQVGKKVRVGLFEPSRHYTLMNAKWMPLERLFRVTHDSPDYNEKDRSGLFYAQSWALVHMLTLGEQYRANGSQVTAAISDGKPAATVFQQAYGKPLDQVQKDLQGYVRSSWQTVVHLDSRLDAKVEQPLVEKANPVDTRLTLAHLLNTEPHRDRARAEYEKVVQEFPGSIEAREALGFLLFRAHDEDAAVKHFAQAYTAGSKNPQALRTYAYLLQTRGEGEAALPVLSRAVESEPEFLEGRLQFAGLLVNLRRYGQAYGVLAEVKSIRPDKAGETFRMMAYCLMRLNQHEQARSYAKRALEHTDDPAWRQQVMSMISHMDRAKAVKEEQAARVAAEAEAAQIAALAPVAAPSLRAELDDQLSGDLVARIKWRNEDLFAAGRFEELICQGDSAILRINTGSRQMRFLMRDPDQIVIKGSAAGTIEMACGPQAKPVEVVVGYGAKPEGVAVDGVVGTLEFK